MKIEKHGHLFIHGNEDGQIRIGNTAFSRKIFDQESEDVIAFLAAELKVSAGDAAEIVKKARTV